MRYVAMTLCICLFPVITQAEIFKCTINGKTVFTDQACDDGEQVELQTTNTAQSVSSADYFYETDFYSSSQWFEGAAGYRKAQQLATTHQAPMIVYFYTDWCVFSNAVSTQLLPNSASIDAMKPFVKVRMNPEQGPAEEAIFKSMNGEGYPRFLVVPYEKKWQRISVTYSKEDQRPEKSVSVNEFVANLAPFQPPPPLATANDHHQRARQMLTEGNQKQAVKDAKIAVSREPYQFEHYKLLDDILLKQKDFKQIISYWDKFIRLSPEHGQALLERAGAHHQNGNANAARADLKRAAELGNQQALELLKRFNSEGSQGRETAL